MKIRFLTLAACSGAVLCNVVVASDPPPPVVGLVSSNTQKTVIWSPYPAAEQYTVRSKTTVTGVFTNENTNAVSGFSWRGTNSAPAKFYSLGVTPMSGNALLTANVLNRIAYGPTPDELERIAALPGGAQDYINEQLAMDGLVETSDAYSTVTTNGVNPGPPTNWVFVTLRARATGPDRTNLYIYLTGVGTAYIDDVQLSAPTNAVSTNNLITNGDFESPLLPPTWNVSANLITSSIDSSVSHSGSSSLRLVSTAPGSTRGSSIWQPFTTTNNLMEGELMVLSFWYLPGPNSTMLTVRVSGNGPRGSGGYPVTTPTWVYATATGVATATPTFYIYLNGAGEAYVDDIKLVAGSVPEAGPNLLQNADFEAPLTNGWRLSADFVNSVISSNVSHSGLGSLKIVATGAGSGNNDSVYQTNIAGVVNAQTYTVSFWYVPATRGQTITARLSGSATPGLLLANPDSTFGNLRRRMDSIATDRIDSDRLTIDSIGGVLLADLRSWYLQNAVGSKRQLLETLTQFLENHFVTQQSKSMDYFDGIFDGPIMETLATDWEYREITKWRNALLNPTCTFSDLLLISAQSPAMIVFMDNLNSKGNGNNIANENYAREFFELFTMGVDNGYDQNDIVFASRAWTGWSVEVVDRQNMDNPFALRSTTFGFYPGDGSSGQSNLVGVYAFNFKEENHGTNRSPIFPGRVVPPRFGSPWAGRNYQLTIPRRNTGDTNGIQDGMDLIRHVSNLPFTMEYISVKLCRWFIHEGFAHGTNDYTDLNRSAEVELIRQCMLAWENSSPKGQIRPVLNTIFNSDLFRSHGGSMQKVRTPLEYTVGAIRALRARNPNGTYTASTDGYSISGRSRTASTAPLTRMGSMMLFDRDAPDGYPEAGSPWISAGTLAERIRFVQTALMTTTDPNKNDGISGGNFNLTDPVALLKLKLNSSLWNNAGAVADYFLSILYPGEGTANLNLYRQLAVDFLNTADNGTTQSLFSGLTSTTTAYDTRVRGMVSMLMTSQRFQEQ